MPFASLSWYDIAEVRKSNDALWARIAASLGEGVPEKLDRETEIEKQWASGELLLGQACGYDMLGPQGSKLQLVATPHFKAPGCEGHNYASVVVVGDGAPVRSIEDLRGARCVINSPTSHSGMNALRALVAPLHKGGRFFGRVEASGDHEASLALVADGTADVTALDCVTHALLTKHRPSALKGTRMLTRTGRAPAPPFVSSRRTPAKRIAQIRAALTEAMEDPALQAAREALLLTGISVLPISAYQPITDMRRKAENLGFDQLPGTEEAAR